ncbi:MAG: hypothetical protein HZB19_17115 [Chloroflexi bacterium]|nr:hypothetical protein [Chloroflexota bacterium]
MKTLNSGWVVFSILPVLLLISASPKPSSNFQADNPGPPDEAVKLVFIHHSTGENWLMDDYGDLGKTLDQNNYFVSDTNYGWGPDAIGDRTDIPNWTEWFASDNTPTYMDALFNENEQHASYTRSLSDPGGENQIIVFKSCFPNSALEGNPNDSPDTEGWLSVGHAKYVYNEILQYFGARPDKLFVVVTAPPLSDPTYADNARAFNEWLVNDWLRENNYAGNNVAVFDFYNVLTDPNAHHRVNNGQIGHIIGTRNTLYYPSGDDHPSEQGSRKATEEFVPVLNVFYHRWKEGQPAEASVPSAETQAPIAPLPPVTLGLLDDFEGGIPAGTAGWEAFQDEAANTSLSCAPSAQTAHEGVHSLQLDFDVAANSWATCALMFEQVQDWSAADGLAFYLRSADAGLVFDVNIYAGSMTASETYLRTIETSNTTSEVWVQFILRWEEFHRADWEENAGEAFAKPNQIAGMAFGFSTYSDTPNTGTVWVDELSLSGEAETSSAEQPSAPKEPEQSRQPLLPCGGAIFLPFLLVALPLLKKHAGGGVK